jgi:hypothetical protein
MRQRISDLEGAIDKIFRHLDDLGIDTASIQKELGLEIPVLLWTKSDTETPNSSTQSAISSFARLSVSEDLSVELDNTPLLTLLNNDVFSSDKISLTPGSESQISKNILVGLDEKYCQIWTALRRLTPSSETITLLLQHSQLSLCLLEKSFPGIQNLKPKGSHDSQIETIHDSILSAFNSEDVSTITHVLIALATFIQQLPGSADLGSSAVRNTLDLLQRRYMEFADAFLTPDEGLVGSIDGLDCLLMQVRFYINAGMPRKSWVIFRRAASFAQILGSFNQRHELELDIRKRRLWFQLWQVDKVMSLLLGLPYMISALPFKIEPNTGIPVNLPPTVYFMFKLGEIGARVIDRNCQGQAEVSYSATLEIDQDCDRCKGIMDSSWWETIPGPDMTLDVIHEICSIKMIYHSIRNHIHLPFVLKTSQDPRYQFSTMIAMESSRETINIYEVMRDMDRPVLRLCNMIDFYTLTAALIIILQLLGNPSAYSIQQQEQDWQKIYGLIRVLKRTALDFPHSVAAQTAQLLEDLIKLRYDFSGVDQSFHAVVPYFGEIRIHRRNGELIPGLLPTSQQNLPTPFTSQAGVPVQLEVDATHTNNQSLQFDFDSFDFNLENSVIWPTQDEEWTSLIDYTLQDGWDWDLNN